jgi:hypothetical protein
MLPTALVLCGLKKVEEDKRMRKVIIIPIVAFILLFAYACDNSTGDSGGSGSFGFGNGSGVGSGSDGGNGNNESSTGASLDLIKASIMGTLLIIDSEEWLIDNNSLENISVISRETTQDKDAVIVEIELKDIVLSANGQMLVEFRKNDDNWILSDYRVSTPFKASVLSHAELNWSDNDFIAEITKHTIVYNEIAARTAEQIKMEQLMVGIVGSIVGMPFLSSLADEQEATDAILETFGMSANEISNFNILYTEMTERGTISAQYGSFILSKGVIDYEVFSEMIFHYDRVNGWLLQDVGFTTVIKAINLENTRWSGTYDGYSSGNFNPNRLVIEFNEVSADGAIKATVTASPPEFKQILVGTVDTSSMIVNLIFNEWISEPSFAGITLPSGLLSFVTEESVVRDSHINLFGIIDPYGTTINSESGTIFEIKLN